MIIISSILFILIAAGLTKIFHILALDTLLMDKPNERSLHSTPKVRGAGIVFIALSLIYFLFLSYYTDSFSIQQTVLSFSIILLAAVSFIDDLYQLSTRIRLLIQCVIGLLVTVFLRPEVLDFGILTISSQLLVIPFVFFAVIWAINHFNFMDGLDGFCGLQALFLFAAYALLFSYSHAYLYQDFCFILMFNLAGFLLFNFPPARLFMGDVGSATLGLITFSLALIAQQQYNIPILYWFILNAIFLFDATITLLRRMLNKEKWSGAHRKHAYQRLKQFGVNTRVILLGQALINACLLCIVMLCDKKLISSSILVLILLAILTTVYLYIEKLFPMSQA